MIAGEIPENKRRAFQEPRTMMSRWMVVQL